MVGVTVKQKWSSKKRRGLKKWYAQEQKSGKIVARGRTYGSVVKKLRKSAKKRK